MALDIKSENNISRTTRHIILYLLRPAIIRVVLKLRVNGIL